MKKTVMLFVLLVCLPGLILAQNKAVDKGMNLIGGSAGFSSSGGELFENSDGDRSSSMHIRPSGLYFIKPGLGVGGSLSYSRSSQGNSSQSEFGIGPKVSYFMNNGPAGLTPYGSASFILGSNSSSYNDHTSTSNQNYFLLEAGLMYMLTDFFGITGGLYFKNVCYSYKDSDSDPIKGNVFGLTFGINAFVPCCLL